MDIYWTDKQTDTQILKQIVIQIERQTVRLSDRHSVRQTEMLTTVEAGAGGAGAGGRGGPVFVVQSSSIDPPPAGLKPARTIPSSHHVAERG